MDRFMKLAILQPCFEYAFCRRTATDVAHAYEEDFEIVRTHLESFKRNL